MGCKIPKQYENHFLYLAYSSRFLELAYVASGSLDKPLAHILRGTQSTEINNMKIFVLTSNFKREQQEKDIITTEIFGLSLQSV